MNGIAKMPRPPYYAIKLFRPKLKNKWKNMLIMNMKNGFEIIGTYIDGEGEIKIILEKKL